MVKILLWEHRLSLNKVMLRNMKQREEHWIRSMEKPLPQMRLKER